MSAQHQLSGHKLKIGCQFSDDRRYRYVLERVWSEQRTIAFIGLNPSTADETQDDPTIRKCIGFAKRISYGRLFMVNLFAYRATQPRHMKRAAEPIGQANDYWIKAVFDEAELVVGVWGVHGRYLERDRQVMALTWKDIYCLGKTIEGHPRHPLYVPYKSPLELFSAVENELKES